MAEDSEKKAATAVEAGPIVTERVVTREVKEPPLGPNATTEPADPKEHYFLASDGSTRINAWGEEKGSAEDKKRMASL